MRNEEIQGDTKNYQHDTAGEKQSFQASTIKKRRNAHNMTVHGISGSAHDSSRPQQIINQLSGKHFTMYNWTGRWREKVQLLLEGS